MNGTRCIKCGRYVYARNIPGEIDPTNYLCEACRTHIPSAGEVRRSTKEKQKRMNKPPVR